MLSDLPEGIQGVYGRTKILTSDALGLHSVPRPQSPFLVSSVCLMALFNKLDVETDK